MTRRIKNIGYFDGKYVVELDDGSVLGDVTFLKIEKYSSDAGRATLEMILPMSNLSEIEYKKWYKND